MNEVFYLKSLQSPEKLKQVHDIYGKVADANKEYTIFCFLLSLVLL